jgi:hypothetical protein
LDRGPDLSDLSDLDDLSDLGASRSSSAVNC